MKNYQIKPEYYDLWGAYEGNDIVTAEEIVDLAREWEMTVDELMEQVEEQTTETTETVTLAPAEAACVWTEDGETVTETEEDSHKTYTVG